ncbi:39S ribosomal protein L35, mitochondrial [Diorhabda carinulata]|uniref:39S ribosomal protein L35, mitochondrial n=1 Tax=Diorhabda carinulata TaxID=1163345 RepID=UPI0025A16DED|nr:39S ribosomal protein L35, mitochondrial [Diorhabda carinulata]
MFKQILFSASRVTLAARATSVCSIQNVIKQNVTQPLLIRNFTSLLTNQSPIIAPNILFEKSKLQTINTPIRTVTKFSYRKGKRKSVKTVLRRFYRLHWGAWIRTKCGRNKKLWKKSPPRKRRLRQHVFCNASQSYKLDKMVGPFWRKRRYYIDDPYDPYHSREEWAFTRTKPRPYIPPEERIQ